jgi:hypothetical protein
MWVGNFNRPEVTSLNVAWKQISEEDILNEEEVRKREIEKTV